MSKLKIMIVDDEVDICNLFRDALQVAGYNVRAFTNPTEALEDFRLHNEEYGVIITDIRMPEMNGDELVNTFLKEKPDLKYVFTSGTPWVTNTPLEEGVNFFQKPFSFREVTTRLKGMIESDRV